MPEFFPERAGIASLAVRLRLSEFQKITIELPRALEAVREPVNQPKITFRRLSVIQYID